LLRRSPLTNADIKEGMNVTVIGLKAPDRWRVPAGFDVFRKALEAMGFKEGYKKIEELKKIRGRGKEATEYEKWLKIFNHTQMFKLAHVCYSFNPGAKLSGDIAKAERILGCTEWSVGNIGPQLITPNGIPGASHLNGICLNSSV